MTDRILVTGGTGFLGQHLVRKLLACGFRVRMLVRVRSEAYPNSRQALQGLSNLGAEVAWGDISDPQAVQDAVQGMEGIFHLAGRLYISGVPESEYVRLHVDGTRNLLQACIQAALRNGSAPRLRYLVHCSSTGVLGPTGTTPLAEDAPMNPSNAYENTKAASERMALEMGQEYNLPVRVARPALAYGPGDLHLLGWFQAIQRGLYRVVGQGQNLLHPVYIDDVINGMLACAYAPQAVGRAYHLVGERPVSIRELAGAIAAALSRRIYEPALPVPVAYSIASLLEALPGVPHGRLPLTRSRVKFMLQNRVYSGERARQELDFSARVSLEDGLQRTVAWYREEGLL